MKIPQCKPPTQGLTAPPDFTTFMRNYQDMVYSTAVRLIGNETQAEDIAQDVFLKAYEHFDNLRTSPTGRRLAEDRGDQPLDQPYPALQETLAVLLRHRATGRRGRGEGGRVCRPRHVFRRRRLQPSAATGSSGPWKNCPNTSACRWCFIISRTCPTRTSPGRLGVSLSKVKTDILRGREALAKILARSGDQPRTICHLKEPP